MEPTLRGRRRHRDSHLAICGHDEDWEAGELRGEVLRQLQRRFVRPLQIVEEDDERRRLARAGEELPEIREQVPLLQVRRQVQRRRHVGEEPMELGHQPRELRCARTNCLAEDRRRHQSRCFLEHLDEGDQRWRALVLVTPSGQRLAPEAPRGSQRFFREPGLPDPRVAEEQNEAAAAGPRLLDALQQLRTLGVASDQPGPVVARRSIGDP